MVIIRYAPQKEDGFLSPSFFLCRKVSISLQKNEIIVKMKKALQFILIAIATIVLAIVGVWLPEIRTAASVHQVGDNKYLYLMSYKANYDIDKVIDASIDNNKKLVGFIIEQLSKGIVKQAPEDAGKVGNACASFQAQLSQGGSVFGRNYDYFKNPSLITITKPKKGYRSIACSDLSHLGYGLDKLPQSFTKKLLCVAAVYAPMDGINEKGLCVSILALPKQASQQNTGKKCLGTSTLMRVWLDRCATVQEALELLNNYDIRHDATVGSGYHYMVSDAQGNSAVVEFDLDDGWKTLITQKDESSNYQLVTNHLIHPKYYTEIPDQRLGNNHSKSWERYAKANNYLQEHNGIVSTDQALECLDIIHWKDFVWEDGSITEDTQYSAVYNQQDITLKIRSWADYNNTLEISFQDYK